MWKASVFSPSLPGLKCDLAQHSTLLMILSGTPIETQPPTKTTTPDTQHDLGTFL